MKYLQERRAAFSYGAAARRPRWRYRRSRPSAACSKERRPRDLHHHGAGVNSDHLDQGRERACTSPTDEARTFGMEGMFRQVGIYLVGRRLTPDADPLFYRDKWGPDSGGGHQRSGEPVFWLAARWRIRTTASHDSLYIYYSCSAFSGSVLVRGGRQPGAVSRWRHRPHTLAGEGPQHRMGTVTRCSARYRTAWLTIPRTGTSLRSSQD
jgi:hypothetical protein